MPIYVEKCWGKLGLKYLGLNSASFSSYGSEKTGTPVKAFIRYSNADRDIRVHSPVVKPHILCIFHQALMRNAEIFNGCTKDTTIVINSENDSSESLKTFLRENHITAKKIYSIPAQKIAMETHSRINVVMLGAMAKAMEFMALDSVYEICKDTLGAKYPEALQGNLEGIKRGYEEAESFVLDAQEYDAENKDHVSKKDKETVWGFENAPIGGINVNYGNSVTNGLSPSRQGYIPIFIQDRCINCGLCDSTCPDMVFQFKKGEYKGREMMVNCGLDYYHCKGCLRCVEVCLTQALVKGVEAEHKEKKWFLPNQDLIRNPKYYEKSGADGYITSESFLTEKQMDGGEV